MNLAYEKIVDANRGITYTDVRGKNYAEVAQRVQAFRKLIPGGFILPEIIKIEDGIVYMKAEAGYYTEDGRKVLLSVGHAFERQDASNINKTSYIENCETSAVGRALGFIGLGSEKSIASAEEVDSAIKTQEAIEQGAIADPATKRAEPAQKAQEAPASVTVAKTVPAMPQEQQKPANPVLEYLARERDNLRAARGISKAENAAIWAKQTEVLKNAGLVPNKALSAYTKNEAETLVAFMYSRFQPTGTELIPIDGEAS